MFVSVYLVFNIAYNILIILILKFGSANILWLAMTIMVPLGSMSFSLDFIPEHKPAKFTDVPNLLLLLLVSMPYNFCLFVCFVGVVHSGHVIVSCGTNWG